VLRPKAGGESAHFYTLVSRDSREQDFAHHRQLFLTEQGYSYRIADGDELIAEIQAEGVLEAPVYTDHPGGAGGKA
jgi:DNA excision repair protein ERCC-3